MFGKKPAVTDPLLGRKVEDSVTGFVGIATARIEYSTGCVQFRVTPRVNKDNKLIDPCYFDASRMVVVVAQAAVVPLPARAGLGGDMGRETPKHGR